MVTRLSVLALCLALLIQGCATAGRDAAVSVPEQQAFATAQALLPGDPEAAARQLEAFLGQWPQSGLADDAAELLANIALERGDRKTEIRWLRYLVDNHPRGGRSDSARLRLAARDFEVGYVDEARSVLAPLRIARLTPEEEAEAYELRADLAETRVAQLRWLARARGATSDPDALRLLDERVDRLLEMMSDEDLERAASDLGRDIPAGRVQLQRAARLIALGEFDSAEAGLRRAERFPLTPDDERVLAELKLRVELREAEIIELPTFAEAVANGVPSTEGARGSIGVVLPLSGPFAPYGEASLKGVLLAARIFEDGSEKLPDVAGDSAPAPPTDAPRGRLFRGWGPRSDYPDAMRILVRDSRGDPKRAAAAVRELAGQGVVAIVGPLLSRSAEAAAKEAQDLEVPLLTLTSREEVPRERPYVFRVRTTPDDEVRFLVDYAIDTLKAERFAILHPADSYGRGMRDRFWKRVESRGGGVVGVSSYDPEATDFAKAIRRLIGYELLTRAERDALAEREALLRRGRRLDRKVAAVVREVTYAIRGPEGVPLPPRVDFDVAFIPDSHEKVVLIAPQLAFHGVTGVTLMGPEGWNHPDLLRIARKHVHGAVMTSPFHKDSRFEPASRFNLAYQATFSAEPEALSAQAYDAANLVQVQLALGNTSRAAVRDGVLRTEGYPGASGVITLLPDGNARKRPFMLGVRRGRIVSLD